MHYLSMRRIALWLTLLSACSNAGQSPQVAPSTGGFPVAETSIAKIQAAFANHSLTCRALVETYLARIAAYDKKGPGINALIVVHPDALKTADSLDARYEQSGPIGPLHCIPMIVKDNYETFDL